MSLHNTSSLRAGVRELARYKLDLVGGQLGQRGHAKSRGL